MTEARDMPRATAESVLEIMGVKLRCYVLNDGRRIFNVDDLGALFQAMADNVPLSPEEARRLAQFVHGKDKAP